MKMSLATWVWIVALLGFGLCYFYYFKYDNRKFIMKRFHNAIKTIYRQYNPSMSYDDILVRLHEDYNTISQHIGGLERSSSIEMIRQICYRYNTYSDQDFQAFFNEKRNLKVQEFINNLRIYIDHEGWYIELPKKDAKLIGDIAVAFETANPNLGQAATKQLAQEIICRENEINEQRYKGKIAEILNIISIAVSVISVIISLFQ